MATTWINLQPNTWTKVAEGACTVQKSGPWEVKVYIGTDTPTDTSPYGIWNYDDFNYGGAEDVHMKCSEPVRLTVFN